MSKTSERNRNNSSSDPAAKWQIWLGVCDNIVSVFKTLKYEYEGSPCLNTITG